MNFLKPELDFAPDVMSEMCPSRRLLNDVTSKWGIFVMLALHSETMRFSSLRRRIGGVSEKMLSQTLKTLEADGFVARRSFDVVPPHVEYSLTEHGMELAGHLKGLALWLEKTLPDLPCAQELLDRK
ncbi:MAG: helix-turn-helix transcriptional regulator [Marivita sp.]|uniref:winged helix-turn-helix transcriptional regulator n=1 Tax=Marivita sp. TaxID=2003365 RepID=UPI0025B9BB96|nr:helix-turn-helix domain-containing protein [Marivita sp.]MCI5112829.1 helix-turn-helix transcriptional regulator [Marivita sp.]